jgi:Uncharacterised nucleotidyltransferase
LAARTHIDRLDSPAPPCRPFPPEFEFLLACSSPPVSFDASLLAALDWERVLAFAEHHRLIPAVHAALARSTGAAVPGAIRDRAHVQACRCLRFTAELARIGESFDRRGIEFLAHKGPALAQVLYNDATLRQFGDLDLLLRPEDVARARPLLLELGYVPELSLSSRQQGFYLDAGYEYAFGLGAEPHILEIQWRIVPRFYSINFDIEALFGRSRAIEFAGASLRTVGREDLMLVLSVHAAKHEWSELGMLRDLATLTQFDLDWKWIMAEARRLGIFKILEISLSTASQLFGLELPRSAPRPRFSSGARRFASAVLGSLQAKDQPNPESFRYFLSQAETRERWRDRVGLFWGLATTPSLGEWRAIRVPDQLFRLYHGVRVARVAKRLLDAIV